MSRGAKRTGRVCAKHPELKGARQAGHCPACSRDRVRRWEIKNRDHANAERRKRYARNPQKRKAVNEKWRIANLATRAANVAGYRARKQAATPALTAVDHLRINALYAEAARRTAETGIVHHVDHDVPLALGGAHHPDNLLVVPAAINLAKGARYASTWDFISS